MVYCIWINWRIGNYLKNKYYLNLLLIKREKLILLIEGEEEKISKKEILEDLKLNFFYWKLENKIKSSNIRKTKNDENFLF